MKTRLIKFFKITLYLVLLLFVSMEAYPTVRSTTQSVIALVDDLTPQLGGDLDVNGQEITSSGNIVLKLGDNAGAYNIIIKDSDGTQVAAIDSDGESTFVKMSMSASSDPKYQVTDSDCGDGDVGFELDIDATATATGTEDYDGAWKSQIGGNLTQFMMLDADCTVTLDDSIDSFFYLGSSAIPVGVYKYSATYSSNQILVAEECLDSIIYLSGDGTTATLPAIFYGGKVAVVSVDATAKHVDVNANDNMILDGTTLDNGDKASSGGTAGEMIVFTYYSADGWYAASDGWTDGS